MLLAALLRFLSREFPVTDQALWSESEMSSADDAPLHEVAPVNCERFDMFSVTLALSLTAMSPTIS